jgi:hypothetical protein
MKYQAKTALGVDLSQTQVCAALVRRDRRRIVVAGTAKVAVPAGLIQDGRITDPVALMRVLADLKSRCKGRPEMVAVSLSGPCARIQILELPNPLPANIGVHIQNEIKQLIPLAADQIVSDHCSLASKTARRVLAAVADNSHVLSLVEACERVWGRVETVEPAILAAIRALHAKKIAGRSDRNVLLASITAGSLELCVFQGGHLDFSRTRDLGEVQSDPAALAERLAEEILAVVQYYSVEVVETPGQWEIMVLGDEALPIVDRIRERLGLQPPTATVEVLTLQHVAADLVAEVADPAILAQTSATAVGLAVRLLGRDEDVPPLNLLPFQIVQRRIAVRHGLIAAVCGAVVLLVMGLGALGLKARTASLAGALDNRKATHGLSETMALMVEHRKLQTQIDQLSKGHTRLEEALRTERQVDWPGLLDDVRNLRPQGLRVTRLSCVSGERLEMLIDGWSLNYGAINQFTKKLDQSTHIASATVVKSGQQDVNGRPYFIYQVRCTLQVKVGI